MHTAQALFLALVALRALAILVGGVFVYMGFRLSAHAVTPAKTGTVEVVWGDRRLALKQAAPGILLVLFGAAVIGMALLSRSTYVDQFSNVSGFIT
jgi:hypothetical protein